MLGRRWRLKRDINFSSFKRSYDEWTTVFDTWSLFKDFNNTLVLLKQYTVVPSVLKLILITALVSPWIPTVLKMVQRVLYTERGRCWGYPWDWKLFIIFVLYEEFICLKNATWSQNKYSTRSPTPCRRLWCWCPRIFGRRHLPSKLAWKMFTLYWRCWCRFYEEKQFVVNFGTWTMNQNVLWQLKSPQTKTRKTKTAC